MEEPLFTLFFVAIPVLVVSLFNILKPNTSTPSLKGIHYFTLLVSLGVVIYGLKSFVWNDNGIEPSALWPSNLLFGLSIFIFVSGIAENIVKRRHSVPYSKFVFYLVTIYAFLLITWKIAGFILERN